MELFKCDRGHSVVVTDGHLKLWCFRHTKCVVRNAKHVMQHVHLVPMAVALNFVEAIVSISSELSSATPN